MALGVKGPRRLWVQINPGAVGWGRRGCATPRRRRCLPHDCHFKCTIMAAARWQEEGDLKKRALPRTANGPRTLHSDPRASRIAVGPFTAGPAGYGSRPHRGPLPHAFHIFSLAPSSPLLFAISLFFFPSRYSLRLSVYLLRSPARSNIFLDSFVSPLPSRGSFICPGADQNRNTLLVRLYSLIAAL